MSHTDRVTEAATGASTTAKEGGSSRAATGAQFLALGLLTVSLLGIGALATAAASAPAPGKSDGVTLVPGAGGTPADQSSACVGFEDLRHCPIGPATLELTPAGDRLLVLNPDENSDAGVSIQLPLVRRWTGRMYLAPAGSGAGEGVLRAVSLSDESMSSRMEAKRTDDGFVVSAGFTGSLDQPTYRAAVYRDGVLQGYGDSVADDSPGVTVSGVLEEFDMDFYVVASGACSWGVRFAEGARTMRLAGGQVVTGDELRLVEEVKPAGRYPYTTFDHVVIRGNSARTELRAERLE